MNIEFKFEEINHLNRHFVNRIFPGDKSKYFLHYNAYWYGQSLLNDDINFRLCWFKQKAVGIVCYGQFYQDTHLQTKLERVAEIIHMVVDEPFQGKGLGRNITLWALDQIRNTTQYDEVRIAHHPENESAKRLYSKLGFELIGENYDGDPLYSLNIKKI